MAAKKKKKKGGGYLSLQYVRKANRRADEKKTRSDEEIIQNHNLETGSINEYIAIGLIDNRYQLVSLSNDGSYRAVDGLENVHNILYILTGKTRAFQHAVEEFEDLMNNIKSKESDFQNFFERFPDFIINDDYKNAHPHIVLTKEDNKELIPDFVLEPVKQNSFCDLLEIKLPRSNIFVLKKNRYRYSSAIMEACAQLREYRNFFDEERNRFKVKETFGLEAYKPKMFVVIGRRGFINPIMVRDMELDFPNLDVVTYDDLLDRANHRLNKMNTFFNNSPV